MAKNFLILTRSGSLYLLIWGNTGLVKIKSVYSKHEMEGRVSGFGSEYADVLKYYDVEKKQIKPIPLSEVEQLLYKKVFLESGAHTSAVVAVFRVDGDVEKILG